MILSLDCARLTERMDAWLASGNSDIRGDLHRFAEGDSIEL
jgi:hypothetical protein